MRAPTPHQLKPLSLAFASACWLLGATVHAAQLNISQVPLFVTTTEKANVLLTLDNSNSMDEDATGQAVGSEDSNSKSEIARSVARSIASAYLNKINLGLMAYKQNTPSSYALHNSPYDVSYDSANYNSSYSGSRDSTTKKYTTTINTRPVYYNVALPFYASSSQGNAFCYSATADFDNGSENPSTGPWDSYRCFTTKSSTSDTLPTPYGNAAAEAAAGYSGFLYGTSFSPTDSDLAQNILDFGRFLSWGYVGTTYFSNTSPGRGYLHTPIQLLDSSQKSTLDTKLACNVPTPRTTATCPTCTSTCSTSGIKNAGLTPLEGTLYTAMDYFGGSWTTTSEGYTASVYPLPVSCGKDFVVLLTDGLPSTDKNGATITNTTTALNDTAAAAAALKVAGVETYMVGFAMPYGTNASQLDVIAAAGGTGTAYSASNLTTLTTALNSIFDDILKKVGSASAVATNSTTLSSNNSIYQAKFNSADWSGQLLAYSINASTGAISSTATWEGGANSWILGSTTSTQTPSQRNIFTFKPSTADGIPFVWPANAASPTSTELDSSQITALNTHPVTATNDGLGSSRLSYLRGDATNEGTTTSSFRIRPANKLGDIVNSTPTFVGIPDGGYPSSLESASYATFRKTNSSRTPMLYVGGNDGMLHGFNATTGQEILGYVPSKVYSNLPKLTSTGYSHQYYVDGTPTVSDVFYGGAWHTVLVGSLAGGGQGIFALDITNPANFTQSTTNAQSLALWEFTDTDNSATSGITDGDADLGLTFSQPAIGRVCTSRTSGVCNSSKWVAIFGNGYNNTASDGSASTTGVAYLYVVDIENGNLLAKLDTKVGSTTTPNGLASPTIVDVNGDYYIDYAYAGDLQGNMWKFDFTGSSISAWKVAYGPASSPDPVYQAKDASGTVQPITTRPQITTHPTGSGYLVYFGTGKYLESGTTDTATTGAQTQTFYGIWDNGAQVNSVTTRNSTNLLQQAIDAETSAWRHVTNNAIDWSTHKGWYMDLCLNTTGSGSCSNNYGEKQVSNSVLQNGRIIFTTLSPSTISCTAGGSSWLMELDFKNGGQTPSTPFDTNADGAFTTTDIVAFGGSVGTKQANGTKVASTGIAGTPTLVYNPANKTTYKYSNLSTGSLAKTDNNLGKGLGRVSWRELLND